MNTREKFVKEELEKIYQVLNISYEYLPYSRLQDDKRFLKIFELLFELNNKADVLRQVVKGSYIIIGVAKGGFKRES